MDLIFSLRPTFVARSFTGDIPQMTRVLKAAIQHRGFAFVDMLQACPTYNHFATHQYLLERCKEVTNHDASDFEAAKKLASESGATIPTGILYQNETIPSFYERLVPRQGKTTMPVDEVVPFDITPFLAKMR
jgi:2-oxoglutarate ferredoxin oxidoreductase subunit beta